PCSKRYLNISRTRRISSLSAGIPFLPRHRRRKKLHTSRTPTPDASPRGPHHLGIRGRLFLGIGGRDHFGIRGRIASEFAGCLMPSALWAGRLSMTTMSPGVRVGTRTCST
ncbi:hypothetical protein CN200_05405, partial [Sinorhizobium meliloti]